MVPMAHGPMVRMVLKDQVAQVDQADQAGQVALKVELEE